jgi:hypothetical protein
MNHPIKPNHPWIRLSTIAAVAALAWSASVEAQPQPVQPAPGTAPAPTTPPPSDPLPPPQPPGAPEPAAPVQLVPAPPTAPPTSEVPEEPAIDTTTEDETGLGVVMAPVEEAPPKPAVSVGAWARIGNYLHDYNDPEKMDRLTQDAELNLFFSAPITDEIGLAADLVGTYGPVSPAAGDINGTIRILDLIAKFDIHESFHIWVGRMLVPSDRANFSGTWFASPWYYTGQFVPFEAPVGPRQGPNGRNDGLTFWGEFAGGLFKYYLSAFNLHEPATPPLYSGRLNLSLINPESGYYHNSTYYGEKDIFAIAVAGQYQNDGSAGDDYSMFNADLLFEKNLGGSGTLTLEGAFYKYMGDGELLNNSWLALVSYLTPDKVGFGKIQPLFRLQMADPEPDGLDTWRLIDVQLGYVIDGFAARLALGYQNSDAPLSSMPDMGGLVYSSGNTIYLGTQLQI